MTTADMITVARIGFSAIQLKKKTPYVFHETVNPFLCIKRTPYSS